MRVVHALALGIGCGFAHAEGPIPALAHAAEASGSQVATAGSAKPADSRGGSPRAFLPSQTRLQGPVWTGDALGNSRQCAGCHQSIYQQWRGSAHALSSFSNPLYRSSVDALRRTAGARATRHCGGCHDPALLVDNGLDSAIEPNDPRVHAGVSCLTCHSAAEARSIGNGSYTLSPQLTAKVLEPRNPQDLEQHRAALSPSHLGSSSLCGSCHRSFLDTTTGNAGHLSGMDDLGDWQRSGWAGPSAQRLEARATRRTCQACHMPKQTAPEGPILSSHRFAGGHTWLASSLGEAPALAAATKLLQGAVRIGLRPSLTRLRGREPREEDLQEPASADYEEIWKITLDVTLENEKAGHSFPGGTKDLADSWLEVEVADSRGRVLLNSVPRQIDDPDPAGDRGLHRLRALAVDRKGRGVWAHETSRLVSVARDTTLAANVPQVVRYAGVLPMISGPLRLTVELKHRSRNRLAGEAACRAQGTRAGRQLRTAALVRGRYFDACRPQPVTRVARAQTSVPIAQLDPLLIPAHRDGPSRIAADERWASGMLTSAPGELLESPLRLVESHLARADLPRALRQRLQLTAARLHTALGRFAAGQTRLAPLGPSAPPALWAVFGDLQAAAWRFDEASEAYARASRAAPQDPSLWARWAESALNAGWLSVAERAANAGLRLAPLEPTLLRARALSRGRSGKPGGIARAAYLARLEPPGAAEARQLCRQQRADCRPARFGLPLRPPQRGGSQPRPPALKKRPR